MGLSPAPALKPQRGILTTSASTQTWAALANINLPILVMIDEDIFLHHLLPNSVLKLTGLGSALLME